MSDDKLGADPSNGIYTTPFVAWSQSPACVLPATPCFTPLCALPGAQKHRNLRFNYKCYKGRNVCLFCLRIYTQY